MLTQTVEYALRVMVRLAAVQPKSQTTDELCAVTRVPRAYLSKVVQALVRGGLLRSQRGVNGGVSLLDDPANITILDVVNAVDPVKRIRTCPLGLAAHGTNLCPLHFRMDAAMAHIEAAFASSTLADVLADPSESVPLCPFPRGRAPRGSKTAAPTSIAAPTNVAAPTNTAAAAPQTPEVE